MLDLNATTLPPADNQPTRSQAIAYVGVRIGIVALELQGDPDDAALRRIVDQLNGYALGIVAIRNRNAK